MKAEHPRLVITMGDPAGIGPEVIVKAFQAGRLDEFCRPFVVGSAGVLQKAAKLLEVPPSVRTVAVPADASAGSLCVVDLSGVDLADHRWGAPGAQTGAAAVKYIRKAVELVQRGEADAVVTAPISKEMMHAAGHRFSGHTELLAHLTGSSDYGMLFVGGALRVILVTIHHALRDVPPLITRDRVLRTLRLAHRAMLSFGVLHPRIGVAALNPHAGEGGLFGDEDAREVLPAVEAARAEGIDASDPLPADTLFFKARNGQYDIVAAMYHDQGLGPLKMLSFGRSVNVTVGLPIVRTSVDHGTAFDIAGRGTADPSSLIEACRVAAQMAKHRTAP